MWHHAYSPLSHPMYRNGCQSMLDPLTRRWPRGYVGVSHETVGSNLLAVLAVPAGPGFALEPEVSARLEGLVADGWYPAAWLLELLDDLDARAGGMGLRQVGRQIFRATHAGWVRRTCSSAWELLYGLDEMYRCANRGQEIGGWNVLDFGPGRAVLEKTTPYHCEMEEGILCEALAAVGAPAAVGQAQCFRKGASSCVFQVTSAFIGRGRRT